VKNSLQKEMYRAIAAPAQLARLIGDGFIFADDPASRIRAIEKIEGVTKKEIERVVGTYILEAKETTVKLIPHKVE